MNLNAAITALINMKFPNPLQKGKLVKRYKRFLTDVELDSGERVTAHCANPGAMLGLTSPGLEVWLSLATNTNRKLRYTWELVRIGKVLVGINTGHPNTLVTEAIDSGLISELQGYKTAQREVKYGTNSRIDILLQNCDQRCYVEIKNVHLSRQPGLAEFPDSITARGTKHLKEMAKMISEGNRAVMVYVIQRNDCNFFSISSDIDITYSRNLALARDIGVEAIAYSCRISPREIMIERSIPIVGSLHA